MSNLNLPQLEWNVIDERQTIRGVVCPITILGAGGNYLLVARNSSELRDIVSGLTGNDLEDCRIYAVNITPEGSYGEHTPAETSAAPSEEAFAESIEKIVRKNAKAKTVADFIEEDGGKTIMEIVNDEKQAKGAQVKEVGFQELFDKVSKHEEEDDEL
jgi:hypothetical protein